ncbi:hypothetical protein PCCS19_08100 [Paenibacillus sp. CCS19]|uniref:hypothetical protein n=1 Tax=Paenibacillus sp. CCS19 TaxID=3158387 RepID=UPI00256D454A|nr:hypothetical protein [Paenibacillus cellulosilyticus]GMK37756.1 hypothetical protein PCCS19_08100 [Paenibacillus cellulosilyticus]
MQLGNVVKSISIGFVIAIVAIGLLPFLVVYSCVEMYGLTESYEWGGMTSLFAFPRLKRIDKGKKQKEHHTF